MGAECSVLEQAVPQFVGKADTPARPSSFSNALEEKYQVGKALAPKVFSVRHRVTQALYVAYRLKRERASAELTATTIGPLKALDHQNICQLIEAFSDKRYVYLVYSKVCGLPLLE